MSNLVRVSCFNALLNGEDIIYINLDNVVSMKEIRKFVDSTDNQVRDTLLVTLVDNTKLYLTKRSSEKIREMLKEDL